MTTQTRPHDELPPPTGPGAGRRRPLWAVAALVAIALLAVAVVVLALQLTRQPDELGPALPPQATPAAPPATGAATTAAPAPPVAPPTVAPVPPGDSGPPPAPADAAAAVWPVASSSIRYATPEAAVRGFATGLVGFRAPMVGEYRSGDSRSGEIEIRLQSSGPATTVFVRRLGDDTWWVLGSATADVRIDSPGAGDTVASPLELTGAALAFEGHVTVRLLQDGDATPLVTGFVTGGGDEQRPFTGRFSFPAPTSEYGSVVLTTESAADGRIWSASVLRVRLGAGG
ncbi:MAG: Gmad2 immunoglobulin-like domain-containing protein [Pseudonocardia sp.]